MDFTAFSLCLLVLLLFVRSFKVDVSRVSPSSQRMEKSWVVCVCVCFFMQKMELHYFNLPLTIPPPPPFLFFNDQSLTRAHCRVLSAFSRFLNGKALKYLQFRFVKPIGNFSRVELNLGSLLISKRSFVENILFILKEIEYVYYTSVKVNDSF